MESLLAMGVGAFVSSVSWLAVTLSRFIWKMEDGLACSGCEEKGSCFAKKESFFFDSDNWNLWMLLSFLKVRKQCPHSFTVSLRDKMGCFIPCFLLFLVSYWSAGMGLVGFLYGITAIALFFLSIVDWNTQYIPLEMTGLIFLCGLVRLFTDLSNWADYLIGLFAVSGFLFIVDKLATPILRKRYGGQQEVDGVMGDGDIKLMAVTGLLLGWKLNFFALEIGCITGSVIHLIRMKVKGSGRQLAFGPYLSLGVYITMICSEQLEHFVGWYTNIMGASPM